MKILICGAGALGSNLSAYLSSDARDDHEITVWDKDGVEERNIRAGTQFYLRSQIGLPKVEALQYNIHQHFNRTIKTIDGVFTLSEKSIIRCFNLVIDCFDNFEARRAITEACRDIPCVHLGFGKNFTWSILWNEGYVPPETAVDWDICEMEGAASFVRFVASVGSLTVQEFVTKGKQREFVGNKLSMREIL
mgnify:CR=1 FL=1